MFCPSNDTLQSITEKTKLLAQKCTHQMRTQPCLSPLKKDNTTAPLLNRKELKDGVIVASGGSPTEKQSSFKCFCPCKGPLNFKVLSAKKTAAEKSGGGAAAARKLSTTKWYVKVIQIYNYQKVVII